MGAGLAPVQCGAPSDVDGDVGSTTCCQRIGGSEDHVEFIGVGGQCCERDFSMSDDEVDEHSPRVYPAAYPRLQPGAWQYHHYPHHQGRMPYVNIANGPQSLHHGWYDHGPGSPSTAAGSFFMNPNSVPPEAYGVNCMPRSDSIMMRAQYLHGAAPQLQSFEDVSFGSDYHHAAAPRPSSWEPQRGRSWEPGHGERARSGSQPLAAERVTQGGAGCMSHGMRPEDIPTLPALQGTTHHQPGALTPGYGGGFTNRSAQAYIEDPMMSTNHLPSAPVNTDRGVMPTPVPTGRMASGRGLPGLGELDVTKRRDDLSASRMFSTRGPGQMNTMTLPMVMMDD